MLNNVITIRKETAKTFLPAEMHKKGAIDLHALANLAKDAINGSNTSLEAAQQIVDGGWISRVFNSGEMQQHIIQSITHIRDISKVNLGLSAICNDLAAANLEHASRIDKNHHATNQQLSQVEKMTGALLEHLQRTREPGLLERLLPFLSKDNPSDQDEMRGWLRLLMEEIDLQYSVMHENLDKLAKENAHTVESIDRFSSELARLSESLTDQKDESIRQLGLLSGRLTAAYDESGRRADKADATIRKSHEVLSARLTAMDQHLIRQKTDFQTVIQAESTSRGAMQQTLISLLKQREGAIRTTMSDLHQRLLKRMLWVVVASLTLQLLGFGFLAFKIGLLL